MRARTLVILCLLALSAGSAQALSVSKSSQPVRYIGVVDNLGVNTNPTIATATMKLARDNGFNTVRVIMTWQYPFQHEIENDQSRICNAAHAAAANGMVLFLDIVNKAPNGNYGGFPDRPGKLQMYGKTLTDYLWALIGPNGCAKNLPELDIEIGNEPNYSVFCRSNCPYLYTQMLAYAYATVHQEVIKQGFKVPVNVIGGELAASRSPEDFISEMGSAAKQLNITGKFYDMFSYHCYGVDNQQPTPPEGIRTALKKAFGLVSPLLCTEYAVQTGGSDPAIRQLAEAQQASMASQAMQMGACSSLNGVFWFHLLDDPAGPNNWPSGLYYYDPFLGNPGDQPVAKTSQPVIRQATEAASSGGFTCG